MEQETILVLPRPMVRQILDALCERQKVWMLTAEYMETGYTTEACMVEECSSPDEGRSIASYYEEIISSIEKQTTIADE